MNAKWLAVGIIAIITASMVSIAKPDINSVTDNPDPVEVPGYNNITADISNAVSAYAEISYPNASLMGNYSMTNAGGNTWYYNHSYGYPDPLGLYNYTISAFGIGSAFENFTGLPPGWVATGGWAPIGGSHIADGSFSMSTGVVPAGNADIHTTLQTGTIGTYTLDFWMRTQNAGASIDVNTDPDQVFNANEVLVQTVTTTAAMAWEHQVVVIPATGSGFYIDFHTDPGLAAGGWLQIDDVNLSYDSAWSTSAIYNFTVQDTTSPTSSVNALGAYWYNTDATVTATAIDNYELDRVTLYYRYSSHNSSWDPWVNYGNDTTSPWQWTFNFPEGNGHYLFMTRARDTALNVEPAPTGYDERAAYDHQPPSVSNIAASPSTQTACDDVNISCESADTGIGIDALYVEVIYPDCSTANFSMHYDPCTHYYMISCYSQVGTYDYTIYAVDKLGNGITSSVRHFTITSCGDSTPPVTIATLDPSTPDGPGCWYISPVEVTLSATDDDSGVDYTKYRIDSGSWLTYMVPFTVASNGSHQVDFYSVDNGANVESIKHVNFEINISNPMTAYSLSPSGPTGDNGWYLDEVNVTLSAIDPDGIKDTYYRINGGTWLTYTASFLVIDDGIHTVEFYSVDMLDNTELTKSITIKIDGTDPTVSLIRPRLSYLYLFDREVMPVACGITLAVGRLTVTSAAADMTSGVENVTFYTKTGSVITPQSIDLQSPYQWIWSCDIGTRELYAIASDEAGNTAVSLSQMVSIFSL